MAIAPEEQTNRLADAIRDRQVIILPVNQNLLDRMYDDPDIENMLMEAYLQHKIIINVLIEQCSWEDTVLSLFETWPRNRQPLRKADADRFQQMQKVQRNIADPFELIDYSFFREELQALVEELQKFVEKEEPESRDVSFTIPYSNSLESIARDNPLVYKLSDLMPTDWITEDTIYVPVVGEAVPILVGRQDGEQLVIDTIPESILDAINPKQSSEERGIQVTLRAIQKADITFQEGVNQLLVNDPPSQPTQTTALSSRIETAQNILIFVPGLFQNMGRSTQFMKDHEKEIFQRYDLVLYYINDHLYTSIPELAGDLKRQLLEAGLVPGHDKNVVVAGLSTGGLVARYLIEAEGGKDMIQHLILIGTPNQGSPIGQPRMLYRTALAHALVSGKEDDIATLATYYAQTNQLRLLLDVSEHQSDLGYINDSRNPGIPYTLIAGAQENQLATQAVQASLRYLNERSAPPGTFRDLQRSFETANDGLFTVASMLDIPGKESFRPRPQEYEIEAHMLDYLSNRVVVEAILEGRSVVERWREAQDRNKKADTSARNILNLIQELSAEELYELILKEEVTFEELRQTGRFAHAKQQRVRALLSKKEKPEPFVPTAPNPEAPKNHRGGYDYLVTIGIDEYVHFPTQKNAVPDCQAFAKVLIERYQFEAIHHFQGFNDVATRENILESLENIVSLLTRKDNLVLYFSGHSYNKRFIEQSYWVPVDARPDRISDYISHTVLEDFLRAIKARHLVLITDTDFSGTLFQGPPSNQSFQELEKRPSRWVLSAGEQEVVSDGPPGQASPFAESILTILKNNEEEQLPVSQLSTQVIEMVSSNYRQLPQGGPFRIKGHLGGEFVFRLRKFTRGPLKSAEELTKSMKEMDKEALGFSKRQSFIKLEDVEERIEDIVSDAEPAESTSRPWYRRITDFFTSSASDKPTYQDVDTKRLRGLVAEVQVDRVLEELLTLTKGDSEIYQRVQLLNSRWKEIQDSRVQPRITQTGSSTPNKTNQTLNSILQLIDEIDQKKNEDSAR